MRSKWSSGGLWRAFTSAYPTAHRRRGIQHSDLQANDGIFPGPPARLHPDPVTSRQRARSTATTNAKKRVLMRLTFWLCQCARHPCRPAHTNSDSSIAYYPRKALEAVRYYTDALELTCRVVSTACSSVHTAFNHPRYPNKTPHHTSCHGFTAILV